MPSALRTCLAISLFTAAALADDSAALQGTWLPLTAELAGKPFPEEVRKSLRLEIKGEKYVVTAGKSIDRGVCKWNAEASPKELDITGEEGPNKGKTIPAIYELDGETLKVCYNLGGAERPKEFKTNDGAALFLVTYRREQAPR